MLYNIGLICEQNEPEHRIKAAIHILSPSPPHPIFIFIFIFIYLFFCFYK